MAGETWRPSAALKKELLREPFSYSFFQVLRLLRRLGGQQGQPNAATVRVRPDLSLGFPAADVSSIDVDPDKGETYVVTATFLGLYGSSSPLPTFYTEDLLEEAAEDETVTRDFIDILNQHLYELLYSCWTKYRIFVKVVEEQDKALIERLFCLLGLGNETLRSQIPDEHRLLRYLGLITQHPRSALGLKTMLSDALEGVQIDIEPCIPRQAKIPVDQRCSLGVSGSTLGVDTYVGSEIQDRTGKFRIKIGPVSRTEFMSLLPGQDKHSLLIFLTDFYISGSLEYDMELCLAAGQTSPVCLGDPETARLGWNTWIFAGRYEQEARVIFEPMKRGEEKWSA